MYNYMDHLMGMGIGVMDMALLLILLLRGGSFVGWENLYTLLIHIFMGLIFIFLFFYFVT